MLSLKIAVVLLIVKLSLSQQFSHYSDSQQFSQFSQFSHSQQAGYGQRPQSGNKPQRPFVQPQQFSPQTPFRPPHQQNRPQNGFGPSQNGFGSPQNGFGSPQNGFDVPQNGFGPPQNGFGSPQNGFGSPQNGFSSQENYFSSPQNGLNTHKNPFGTTQHQFVAQNQNFPNEQQFISPPLCLAVQYVNQTKEGWYGNLLLTAPKSLDGVKVDVMFDDFVPAFANNFGQTTSTNNRIFSIKNESKKFKQGDKLKIEFFASSSGNSKIPFVAAVRLNNASVCPEEAPLREGETSCVKVEMKGDGIGGRWDGVLTVYPQFARNSIQIDVEIDEPAWALGNDLGETKTSNQKRFTINGRRNTRPGVKLPVNFFLKFDELGEIPQIRKIWIDGAPVCVSGKTENSKDAENKGGVEAETVKQNGISLSNLPFQSYPSVTSLPQQVNNRNFDCGSSQNQLQNRFSRGTEADRGQFPFHTAVFRDDIYQCGGSLVSERTVITACHCVVNDAKNLLPIESFRLLFGSVDLNSLTGDEALREVSEIIKHPEYEFDKILKQDIALMHVQGKLQFSPSIAPICLYTSQTPITNFVDEHFTVLGFGSNENTREPSRFLNHGKMSVISRSQCIESKLIYGLLPEKSAFCAKAVNNMTACTGDSGGGMIFVENGKYFLRGISSVTVTADASIKCDSQQSIAFTDVSFFLTWIQQNL